MNKKIYIIIIAVILLFVTGIILFFNHNKTITPEDAEKLCYFVLGEKDEETGFPFSFGYTQTIEKDGKKYYVIRASWLVNNSHLSYIGDFFVSEDGKEIYNGIFRSDECIMENIIWSK